MKICCGIKWEEHCGAIKNLRYQDFGRIEIQKVQFISVWWWSNSRSRYKNFLGKAHDNNNDDNNNSNSSNTNNNIKQTHSDKMNHNVYY